MPPEGIFGPLKFIPLDPSGRAYLSIGGEIRERYEFTDDPAWGDDPQDERGVFLQRYILHGDLHLGKNMRLFGQLLSALENGRAGGGSPVDENKLTVQNAFVDLGNPELLVLRGGRQEVVLGSERLVSAREGPNVRRKFDGVRVLGKTAGWQWSPMWLKPAEDDTGILNDQTDDSRTLWGLYIVGAPLILPGGSVDLYYLGFRDKEAGYEQGDGVETRHSVGLRWWGEQQGWDFNAEGIFQWGRFGRGDIRAWTLASTTGFTWRDLPLRPRLALSANIASGDRDPGDPDLESFNALFPRGNYFSELALLGPRNFFNVHPFLTLNLPHDISLTGEVNFYWRQSRNDGVYGPSGNLLRAGSGHSERYVGAAASFNCERRINRWLSTTLIYTHFFPEAFIKETGRSEDIDFTEFTVIFLF
ncbi:alginate export family protein [Desulfuromonas sp. TF]|uniref:alginate export family protein n=1 Tax=Desulfuromonas sp. TF TaxID=1232410 RepID=UPI000408AFC7|nr:alginate export family protein [Desulfuromonas sp. TF]